METSQESEIQRAISEAKSGNRISARNILFKVVKQTPDDARVWYLLSQVVDKPDNVFYCLERVLKLQPDNEQAKQRIQKIKTDVNKPAIAVKETLSEEKPLIPRQSDNLRSSVDETKKCPYCAEVIKEDAIICRFCGRELSNHIRLEPVIKQKEKPLEKENITRSKTMLIIAVVISIIAIIIISMIGISIADISTQRNEFKTLINPFFIEADKLSIMADQGVNISNYKTQLVEVKSKYSQLQGKWSNDLQGEKVYFDKSVEGWDITLELWNYKIEYNTLALPIYDLSSSYEKRLIEKIKNYLGPDNIVSEFIGIDDILPGLMEESFRYYEIGKNGVLTKMGQ